MLKQLQIRDFAVIEELDVEFGPGLTVFTGETGTGKSILIDALGLVLGDRGDAAVIRGGCERAEITAAFDIPETGAAAELLCEQDLGDAGGEVLVRRVVGRDGRSRGYINGSAAPMSMLRELGERLIDIHGQHAHQSLMKRETQRELLDAFGEHDDTLRATEAACAEWREATRELAELSGDGADHEAQLNLLEYQVQEMEAAEIREGELEELEEEHRRLANANTLLEAAQHGHAVLYDEEESAGARLGGVIRSLRDVRRFDERVDPILELLDGAGIQLAEAADALRQYLDRLDQDPERLRQVESRLDTLHELARKHRIPPQQLSQHFSALQERLDELRRGRGRAEELKAQQAGALARYRAAADTLHERRAGSAKKLAAAVAKQIHALGMTGGKISIAVEREEHDAPRPAGDDLVEFRISLNPGQPERPLSRVASGGELSRISLAVQVIAVSDRGLPTWIFDEVDAGIGGAIAEIVGRLLRELAHKRQIICVTHLPQVASLGDHHFQVEKSSTRTTTRTRVAELAPDDRVEEIARMLGGLEISEKTRAHAREMLNRTG